MTFGNFQRLCLDAGLEARKCHDTHWQIRAIGGDCLVNVWPTTNRWSPAYVQPGQRAWQGGPQAAVKWAEQHCPSIVPPPQAPQRPQEGKTKAKASPTRRFTPYP